MNNKTIIKFDFYIILEISKPQLFVVMKLVVVDSDKNQLDNSSYHAQSHSIIVK